MSKQPHLPIKLILEIESELDKLIHRTIANVEAGNISLESPPEVRKVNLETFSALSIISRLIDKHTKKEIRIAENNVRKEILNNHKEN